MARFRADGLLQGGSGAVSGHCVRGDSLRLPSGNVGDIGPPVGFDRVSSGARMGESSPVVADLQPRRASNRPESQPAGIRSRPITARTWPADIFTTRRS